MKHLPHPVTDARFPTLNRYWNDPAFAAALDVEQNEHRASINAIIDAGQDKHRAKVGLPPIPRGAAQLKDIS
jgi:hypothetical protein